MHEHGWQLPQPDSRSSAVISVRSAPPDTTTLWTASEPRRPNLDGPDITSRLGTLADGWAYKKLYISEQTRRAALPGWIRHYNQHRQPWSCRCTRTDRSTRAPVLDRLKRARLSKHGGQGWSHRAPVGLGPTGNSGRRRSSGSVLGRRLLTNKKHQIVLCISRGQSADDREVRPRSVYVIYRVAT
jgi:hypothetical protein